MNPASLMASPNTILKPSIAAGCRGAGDTGVGLEGVSAQASTICGLYLLMVLCPGSDQVLVAL